MCTLGIHKIKTDFVSISHPDLLAVSLFLFVSSPLSLILFTVRVHLLIPFPLCQSSVLVVVQRDNGLSAFRASFLEPDVGGVFHNFHKPHTLFDVALSLYLLVLHCIRSFSRITISLSFISSIRVISFALVISTQNSYQIFWWLYH